MWSLITQKMHGFWCIWWAWVWFWLILSWGFLYLPNSSTHSNILQTLCQPQEGWQFGAQTQLQTDRKHHRMCLSQPICPWKPDPQPSLLLTIKEQGTLAFSFLFLKKLFIYFLLYSIVLVLPYINMHPPWVYTHWPFQSSPETEKGIEVDPVSPWRCSWISCSIHSE